MLRTLSFGHRMVDIDLGEHFLNHPIHDKLIKLSAVDLTPFKEHIKKELPGLLEAQELSKNHVFGAWTRAWMGAKPSPEWAVRFYYIADEFVRGNDQDPSNPFFFDQVIINAVGAPNFNPALSWVF